MEDVYLYPNNRERMKIEFNGKACEITPCLTVFDLTFVKTQAKKSDAFSFDEMVAIIIANHTEGVFGKEEILELEKHTIQKYIEICIRSDKKLEESFNSIECDNIRERFIQAILKTSKYYDKTLKTQINNSLNANVSKISEAITSSLVPMLAVTNYSSKIAQSFSETIEKDLKPIFKTIKLSLDFSSILKNISDTLINFAKSIKIATLSEDEKQQLIKSYKEWGKTGWTLPLQADTSIFSTPPQDIKTANAIFKSYTTKKDMDALFIKLSDMKHINKSVIAEAIECFNKKYYKACASLLFSLIDARLIRLQGRPKPGIKRDVGTKAIRNAFVKLGPQTMDIDDFYNLLNHVNITCALYKVFEDGNDFKTQPKVINRNFIDHGMAHKKVTRKDCCLIFLLLYNFTIFLNS